MLKKARNSKIFISTVVILLSTAVVFLLGFKPMNPLDEENVSSITSPGDGESGTEDTSSSQIFSNLGMCLFSTVDGERFPDPSIFDNQVDTLLANGFSELRIDIPGYIYEYAVADSKKAVKRAIDKGANVIWGVCGGGSVITAENWPEFRQAILESAQWAQDNGVYEFQLGNEEECRVDGATMTEDQLIANLKSVATEVQEIYTIGKVSYSITGNYISNWSSEGKGDVDIIAGNIYIGGTIFNDWWKSCITDLVDAFGPEGTYLSEFGPSWSSLNAYSTDESVQAEGLEEMIEYIESAGMERACFFSYYDNSKPFGATDFGALKTDGTYRELWDVLVQHTGTANDENESEEETEGEGEELTTTEEDEEETVKELTKKEKKKVKKIQKEIDEYLGKIEKLEKRLAEDYKSDKEKKLLNKIDKYLGKIEKYENELEDNNKSEKVEKLLKKIDKYLGKIEKCENELEDKKLERQDKIQKYQAEIQELEESLAEILSN